MIGAWRLLRRAYSAFMEDDGTALAGYIAFSALLGLFPFMILATSVTAMFVGVDRGDDAIEALLEFAPPHVVQTIEPVLRDILANATGQVLTLSALAALWFSSNAVEAIRTAFDRAYNAPSRGIVTGRLIAFGVVLIGVVAAMALGLTIVLAPLLFALVEGEFGVALPGWLGLLRYGIGLAVFLGFLLFMHRVLPGHRRALPELMPGVLISTLIWIVAATAFSIYLGYTPTYVTTYGALAGVVITLMFFYITGLAVIFGAEINAVRARIKDDHGGIS